MNVIIFGPPGAGKGTQSKKIINNFHLKQVSTGDILRKEISLKTDLGKQIEPSMNSGKFVPDILVDKLIENKISDPKNFNKLIFDGYPRTLSQALSLQKLLRKFKQKISVVLNLNVRKDIIIKRISGRIICNKCSLIFNSFFYPPHKENHHCNEKFLEKRPDDNTNTALDRYETYIAKTNPILDFYRKNGILHEIVGDNEMDLIFSQISHILENIRD